jgi:AraC family transcriptional regulator
MLTQVAGADGDLFDPPAQIIHRERRWFDGPRSNAADFPQRRILASRWVGHASDRCEHEAEIEADCHVLGVALRPMEDLTVFAARKLIWTGHLPQGSMRVNEPGLPMRGIFRGAYDVLHLHVPNTIIAEYGVIGCGQRSATVDPVIERLARALIHAEALGGAFGQSYAEGISLAITAQLLGRNSDRSLGVGTRVAGLSKWRLKRAIDYMEANLGEPIGLTSIAAAAGLSRMHFAAQFRVTTGLRPHEYLLQRRIERAQQLLSTTRLPLIEIAFDVGFKTQAHFTTVFARLVGKTPHVWRQRDEGSRDIVARLATIN